MSRFLCQVIHIFAVIMTAALLSACATTAPVQEMSNARQSIQAAVEIGAEQHAPETLEKARQLLQDASDALDSGNYLLARDYALSAKEFALKAHQTTLSKKSNKKTIRN